ncbi:MAG: NADH-quinone oxidoreductase subunit M [Acidobacteriota bacterium]|nr:NADH-quinone oxidoreductase subunit M [Acidobacteriota bacterium]
MDTLLHLLTSPSLTLLVFFPTLACLPLVFFKATAEGAVKLYTLTVSLIYSGLTALVILRACETDGSFSIMRDVTADGGPIRWIERFGISYDLYMDGIAMPLVALTALLLPLVVLGSWIGIGKHWRGFAASLLLLTTGMVGTLLARDLFLFYVFWEIMLVPMYLLIGIWGGDRRIYAAIKFFLYTMTGSLLMLLAILWMAWTRYELAGSWSFAYEDLLALELPLEHQMWLLAAFGLAFAIKVPLFPFHTWLPDAHVEAPTGGSVILAGVLLKLGTYGLLRFALPFFPHAAIEMRWILVLLAVIGIIYGALVAWRQEDLKRLVAYSSVAHLGFVVLGLAAFDLLAWQGSLLQMVNHGLSTGALFFLVGMLYDRRHTKLFSEFGGLAKVMPWFAFLLVFSTLASVGLPGLNGFAGEFLILTGSFRAGLVWPTVISAAGVILAAVYLFKMLHLTLWGPITKDENKALKDLSVREIILMAPLCLLMLAIGVAPRAFLAPMTPPLEATLETLQAMAARTPPVRPGLAPPSDLEAWPDTGTAADARHPPRRSQP